MMGGHLVQREGAWVDCGPAQSPPRYTKCNSSPTTGQCTKFILFDLAPVPMKALKCVAGHAYDSWRVSGQSVLAEFGVATPRPTSLLHGRHQVARRRVAVRTGTPRSRPWHPLSRHRRNVAGWEDPFRQAETVASSTHHQWFDQRSHVSCLQFLCKAV